VQRVGYRLVDALTWASVPMLQNDLRLLLGHDRVSQVLLGSLCGTRAIQSTEFTQ
jgi:hypothetical protein